MRKCEDIPLLMTNKYRVQILNMEKQKLEAENSRKKNPIHIDWQIHQAFLNSPLLFWFVFVFVAFWNTDDLQSVLSTDGGHLDGDDY